MTQKKIVNCLTAKKRMKIVVKLIRFLFRLKKLALKTSYLYKNSHNICLSLRQKFSEEP